MKKSIVTVRKAKISDLPTIQELGTGLMQSDRRFDQDFQEKWYYSNEGEKFLLNRIKGKKGVCFVAELDQEIVGYLTGRIENLQSWRPIQRSDLNNIFVKSKYRRKGVGGALINAFKQWSKARGVKRIILSTKSKNSEAIEFYQKNNFYSTLLEMEVKL